MELEFENINFSYNKETKVLENIDLNVKPGEVVLIVGNSGCGKSTLLNILNGMIPEVIEGDLTGSVKIEGKDKLRIYERSLIIGNVYQNPRSQFFTNNARSELAFAMENYAYSYEEMKRRIEAVSHKYKIESLIDRDIFTLSSGERQLLALLTALIMKPNLVVFDEPSANLDYGNGMRLRRQIVDLKNEGKSIIVADHRYYYLEGIIDRVFLIEDKKIIEFKSEDDFSKNNYGKRAFKLFSHDFEKREVIKGEKTLVSLKSIGYKNILRDISLNIKQEEITTIVGVNGSGKTTLARLIAGLIKADKGKIEKSGKALYIMQDADFQLFGSSVLKELEITCRDEKKNEEALKLLNLWQLRNKHPQSLSGGEKQRLQLAISYVSDEEIIIFDEPTSGLDKKSMERVLKIFEKIRKNKALIVISHDYEFIRRCSDKVVYIKDSKIEEEFYLEEKNIEKLNNIYKEMEEYYE